MVLSSTNTSISVKSEDAWGQPTTKTKDPHRPAVSAPVPDDWDADDDAEEPDAKTLWVTANSHGPMPEIQLSTTSSVTSVSLPPPAAFEAPMRILKRPPSNSKSPSSTTGTQPQKSFKEREAQYQAARERIFGDDAGKDKDHSREPDTALDHVNSSIIRDPLGPASNTDGEAKQSYRDRRRQEIRSAETTPDASSNHPTDT